MKPQPDSKEATEQGCTCPVIDNGHGKGYMGGVKDKGGNVIFVINASCPIHGEEASKT